MMQTLLTFPFPAPFTSSIGFQLKVISVDVLFSLEMFLGISSGTE